MFLLKLLNFFYHEAPENTTKRLNKSFGRFFYIILIPSIAPIIGIASRQYHY